MDVSGENSDMTKVETFGAYCFGTCLDLDERVKEQVFGLLQMPPGVSAEILSGRVQPVQAEIPDVGAVVIKHYRRGGLIRHLNKELYVRCGKPRPQREYEMLERVRRLGVSSPQPLLWAVRGRFVYRAFLITRKIERHRSLTDIGRHEPARCQKAILKTAGQIRLLIENGIHHVDLHPGNVLVDENGQVFIIDFDKARTVVWSPERLRAAYINRWERAVKKYSLPSAMTDQLVAGLNI